MDDLLFDTLLAPGTFIAFAALSRGEKDLSKLYVGKIYGPAYSVD